MPFLYYLHSIDEVVSFHALFSSPKTILGFSAHWKDYCSRADYLRSFFSLFCYRLLICWICTPHPLFSHHFFTSHAALKFSMMPRWAKHLRYLLWNKTLIIRFPFYIVLASHELHLHLRSDQHIKAIRLLNFVRFFSRALQTPRRTLITRFA